MDETTSFGLWVKRRRKMLDLTQAELAERVGCAMMTVQKIEADERRPSKELAERLAELLEVPDAEHGRFVKAARAELAADHLAAAPARAEDLPPLPALGSSQMPTGDIYRRRRHLSSDAGKLPPC